MVIAIIAILAAILFPVFAWEYFDRGHVGATAWYILAKLRANPYWLE